MIAVSAGFPAYGDYMGLAYARPLEAAGALPVQLPFLADPAAVLGVADGVRARLRLGHRPGALRRRAASRR